MPLLPHAQQGVFLYSTKGLVGRSGRGGGEECAWRLRILQLLELVRSLILHLELFRKTKNKKGWENRESGIEPCAEKHEADNTLTLRGIMYTIRAVASCLTVVKSPHYMVVPLRYMFHSFSHFK